MTFNREYTKRLNIVKVDIVDNDIDFFERVQATFYLVNPDKEKLDTLQTLLNNRFDDENSEYEDFGKIYDYVAENFICIDIDTKEINW